MPQLQLPLLQLFASMGAHVLHAAPFAPHAWVDGALHSVPPAQQPVHCENASHTHEVPLQRVPAGQAGPVPHAQAEPFAAHTSPRVVQSTQAPPSRPQRSAPGGVMHKVPEQQPAQVAGSQTHAPPWQIWPAPHAGPAPHTHDPAAEHASAFPGGHGEHCEPAVPQLVNDFG